VPENGKCSDHLKKDADGAGSIIQIKKPIKWVAAYYITCQGRSPGSTDACKDCSYSACCDATPR